MQEKFIAKVAVDKVTYSIDKLYNYFNVYKIKLFQVLTRSF